MWGERAENVWLAEPDQRTGAPASDRVASSLRLEHARLAAVFNTRAKAEARPPLSRDKPASEGESTMHSKSLGFATLATALLLGG